MIGQMVKGAGGALRPSILALAIAALIAAMLSVSADSASALVIFDRDNDHDRNNGFEVNGLNFDDQELESGDIETETDISIEGNNNNQCVGLSQFGNTGNFGNQQGATFRDGGDHNGDDDDWWNRWNWNWNRDHDDNFRDGNGEFDIEFSGPEVEFGGDNETACEQAVQQAAAASSTP